MYSGLNEFFLILPLFAFEMDIDWDERFVVNSFQLFELLFKKYGTFRRETKENQTSICTHFYDPNDHNNEGGGIKSATRQTPDVTK